MSNYRTPEVEAKSLDGIPKASGWPVIVEFAGLPLKPLTPGDVEDTTLNVDVPGFLHLRVRVTLHMHACPLYS